MIRAIVDTVVLVGGCLDARGAAARVVDGWAQGTFTLCCAPAQLAEVALVLQRAELSDYVQPQRAAQLLQDLDRRSEPLRRLRVVNRCVDPASNVLLGLAAAGRIDALVVEEGGELFDLGTHGVTRIVTAHEFAVALASAN